MFNVTILPRIIEKVGFINDKILEFETECGKNVLLPSYQGEPIWNFFDSKDFLTVNPE